MEQIKLSEREKEILRQAMLGIVRNDWIGDEEFQTRIGVTRAELTEIANRRSPDFKPNAWGRVVICNSVNEICNGVRISEDEWGREFKFSREEADSLCSRLAKS